MASHRLAAKLDLASKKRKSRQVGGMARGGDSAIINGKMGGGGVAAWAAMQLDCDAIRAAFLETSSSV